MGIALDTLAVESKNGSGEKIEPNLFTQYLELASKRDLPVKMTRKLHPSSSESKDKSKDTRVKVTQEIIELLYVSLEHHQLEDLFRKLFANHPNTNVDNMENLLREFLRYVKEKHPD